jgi:hypothetical protein
MFILDIIGRPPEHLVETLENLIKEMSNEKGVEVKSKSIKEPVLMKESKQFYTTFAEIEIEVEDMLYLAMLMFKYMPAHVEVISPEIIAVSNNSWSEILSELTRRLHAYDEVARLMQLEQKKLLKKIVELGGEIPGQVMAPPSQPIQKKEENSSKRGRVKEKPKKKPTKKSKKK